jgi:hypothetical protein
MITLILILVAGLVTTFPAGGFEMPTKLYCQIITILLVTKLPLPTALF